MKSKTFLLLGGYGGVGRVLAPLLLKEVGTNLIIAGRRKEKAEEFAGSLRREFPDCSISGRYADACSPESLAESFRGVEMVIVLTTTPELIQKIGEAALRAGSDYMDILVSESTVRDLNQLAASIKQKNRIFITQAGFHPGLPAVFVRYAARYFDRYEKSIIGMAMNARFDRPEQATEIIPMLSGPPAEICKRGVWSKASYRDVITMDMGSRFGKKQLYPLPMPEIRRTQEMFHLHETGAYVSGFNWFVDNIIFPVIMAMQKIKKGLATGPLTRLFVWGVNTFSSRQQGVAFVNEAEGVKNGKKINVRIFTEHDDPYLFTAIPLVACIKQYLGSSLPPGLGMMGHVVNEEMLINDMRKMGAKIKVETAIQ